jgi:hypothetical protein
VTALACIGHWYVSLIYAAPVVLIGGGLVLSNMIERRRARSPKQA